MLFPEVSDVKYVMCFLLNNQVWNNLFSFLLECHICILCTCFPLKCQIRNTFTCFLRKCRLCIVCPRELSVCTYYTWMFSPEVLCTVWRAEALKSTPLYWKSVTWFSTVFGEEETGFSQRIRHVLIGHAVNPYMYTQLHCLRPPIGSHWPCSLPGWYRSDFTVTCVCSSLPDSGFFFWNFYCLCHIATDFLRARQLFFHHSFNKLF